VERGVGKKMNNVAYIIALFVCLIILSCGNPSAPIPAPVPELKCEAGEYEINETISQIKPVSNGAFHFFTVDRISGHTFDKIEVGKTYKMCREVSNVEYKHWRVLSGN
jgi:hypothetical protein